MTPAKSSFFRPLKSTFSALALAAGLLLHSGNAAAQYFDITSFWGVHMPNFVERGVEFGQTAFQYAAQIKDWENRVKNLEGNALALVNRYKDMLYVPAPDVEVTVDKIKAAVRARETKLSDGAKAYFPEENVCKSSDDSASIVGAALGVGAAGAKQRLEYICISKRELAAMTAQENLNYIKIMESYKTTISKIKSTEPTDTTGKIASVAATIAAMSAAHEGETNRHNSILALIQNQQETLSANQRDIETTMLQGVKGNAGIVSAAVKTAVINKVLGGSAIRAVDGNRQTTSYAN